MARAYVNQTNYEVRMKGKGFAHPRMYCPDDRVDELKDIAEAMRVAYLDDTLGAEPVDVACEVSLDRLKEFYQYVEEFNHL